MNWLQAKNATLQSFFAAGMAAEIDISCFDLSLCIQHPLLALQTCVELKACRCPRAVNVQQQTAAATAQAEKFLSLP